MPELTKIVLHFADGSTHEVTPGAGKSLFTTEGRGRKCGYKIPPKPANSQDAQAPSTDDDVARATMLASSDDSGKCYWVNNVLVCD